MTFKPFLRIQEEKFYAILKATSGKPYTDKDFPASLSSLIHPDNRPKDNEKDDINVSWEEISWTRANELDDLKGDLKLFEGKIEPDDIKQGSIGNCYFLSVLSALAEREQRIRKLFVSHVVNEEGVYGVIMSKNGIN